MPSLILIKAPGGSSAGQAYPLTADAIVLGREETCDIVIPNHAVSRRHAQITRSNGRYFIDDLKSRNHPFPDLAREGDWYEAPFWVWRPGSPRRSRLFVQHRSSSLALRLGQGRLRLFGAELDGVERIAGQAAAGSRRRRKPADQQGRRDHKGEGQPRRWPRPGPERIPAPRLPLTRGGRQHLVSGAQPERRVGRRRAQRTEVDRQSQERDQLVPIGGVPAQYQR